MFWTHTSKNFVRIPTDTRCSLYASPMPFGPYDPFNQIIKVYKRHRIGRAVVLVTDDEIQRKAKRDLFAEYDRRGIAVTHFPIQDFTAPPEGRMCDLVPTIIAGLDFENIVVHCNAGVGRTGVVIGCIIKKHRRCSGEEAIATVKASMMTDLIDEQKRFIARWPIDGTDRETFGVPCETQRA